jgi:hypothetical protein
MAARLIKWKKQASEVLTRFFCGSRGMGRSVSRLGCLFFIPSEISANFPYVTTPILSQRPEVKRVGQTLI